MSCYTEHKEFLFLLQKRNLCPPISLPNIYLICLLVFPCEKGLCFEQYKSMWSHKIWGFLLDSFFDPFGYVIHPWYPQAVYMVMRALNIIYVVPLLSWRLLFFICPIVDEHQEKFLVGRYQPLISSWKFMGGCGCWKKKCYFTLAKALDHVIPPIHLFGNHILLSLFIIRGRPIWICIFFLSLVAWSGDQWWQGWEFRRWSIRHGGGWDETKDRRDGNVWDKAERTDGTSRRMVYCPYKAKPWQEMLRLEAAFLIFITPGAILFSV